MFWNAKFEIDTPRKPFTTDAKQRLTMILSRVSLLPSQTGTINIMQVWFFSGSVYISYQNSF